jgi:nucleotide-binding universal stress UspA family protein
MEKDSKTEGEQKPRRRLKVLVAIDPSNISDMVVKRSGQFHQATGCELTLLHVIEFVEHRDAALNHPIFHEKEALAKKILENAQKTLKQYDIECETRKTIGPIASEIVRIADEGNFDIIFVGSRGLGGIKRMLLGSVADDVMRHAHCSVMLVR